MKTIMIKCTDCYEEQPLENQRCQRCGRLLDDAKRDYVREGHFEWQHFDAPDTIVRRDKPSGKKNVW